MIRVASDLLQPEGFFINSSTSSVDGIKKVRANPPDLILLDVRLPEMDGYKVCKDLKADLKTRYVPIIMVSVKSDETDVVVGLELGADDYITKPFRRKELLARIKTVLRRKEDIGQVVKLEKDGLEINFLNHTAWLKKKKLALTPKEFELLGLFMKMEGRILTRAVISESVWGMEYLASSRTIDVHVDQLRRKLGTYREAIQGLKGIGYRFELGQAN